MKDEMAKRRVTEKEKVRGRGKKQPGCYMESEWRETLLHVAGIWSQLWQQSRKARSRESRGGAAGSYSLYTGKAGLMELKDDTDVSLWPSQPSVMGNWPSHTGPVMRRKWWETRADRSL